MKHDVVNGIVQVPEADYRAMLEQIEMMNDVAAFDKAIADADELIPLDIAKRLTLGDESPLKIWREYRALTQQRLADMIGMTKTTISEIENGKKRGSIETLKKIAFALDVDLDDLVWRA